MKWILSIFFALFLFTIQAQTVPNFTVTDTDGKTHKLYEDYLNNGKYVVFKIFFVNCPPCNAIAPQVQQKFVEWGSGNGNVQFIEVTNKIGDKDSQVKYYKNLHGITFPSISADGGSLVASEPYINGSLGQWSGTPFFAILTPQKTLQYDVLFNNLDAMLRSLGASQTSPPNTVNLSVTSPFTSLPSGVSYILKSDSQAGGVEYNITELTGGSNTFQYPSAKFPEIPNPVVVLKSPKDAYNGVISVSDIILIKNHVLGTVKFTKQSESIAADVNGDGKISVSDIVVIQRVILKLINEFPNNVPSYKMLPNKIPLSVPSQGGGQISLTGELIKMGNVR